mgnify:CR=1 FL=1|jgi:hypothetical protein
MVPIGRRRAATEKRRVPEVVWWAEQGFLVHATTQTKARLDYMVRLGQSQQSSVRRDSQ